MNIDHQKIKKTAEEAASVFVKNYKLPLQDAIDFFYEKMMGDEEISNIITASANEKQLAKNAAFKNFLKRNKKELYYKLRKYKGGNESRDELLQELERAKEDPNPEVRMQLLQKLATFHVSSQERYHENELFYSQLGSVISNAVFIADVGCGVQPLFFPHAQFSSVKKYIALDKDREAVQLMQAFKEVFKEEYQWLFPQVWNINEGWESVMEAYSIDNFDAALILKVIPVVKRVEPLVLAQLGHISARRLVISGVKESMVKKHDIEHKERRAISRFISEAGKTVVSGFELENEFFIVVE